MSNSVHGKIKYKQYKEDLGEGNSVSMSAIAPTVIKHKNAEQKKRIRTICTAYCHFDAVKEMALLFGLKEVPESQPWNVFWTDMSVSMERAKEMKRFQRINHFPGMAEICRKDLLARNLGRMKKRFPTEYNFFPKTWILPTDFGVLYENYRRKKTKVFILKPFLSSQGRGIIICKGLKDLRPYEHMICQLYIKKPFLIDGFKFDLRVYALLTSCEPLRIFVYNEGLVRLATKKYSRPSFQNISNVYMHLTNYAVNKFSSAYVDDDELGSKRKISTLNNWLYDNNYDVEGLWNQIDDIIIKTILCAYPTINRYYFACFSSIIPHQACFELLGFDILLDQKLKPYLLEVNHSPSFSTNTKVDQDVKRQLLYDTFSILNLGSLDSKKVLKEDKQRCRERLLQGLSKTNEKNISGKKMHPKLKAQEMWEAEHIGNFRLIYPADNSSKYDTFFEENIKPPVQTIAFQSSKVNCQQNKLQTQENIQSDAAKRVVSKSKDMTCAKTVENKHLNFKVNKTVKMTKVITNPKESQTELIDKSHKGNYILNSFEPNPLESEYEEQIRVRQSKSREFMVKRLKLAREIYFSMKKNKLLSTTDMLKYSSFEEKTILRK